MSNEYVNALRRGGIFPSSSSATLCFTKNRSISNIELSYLKKKILEYLKTHDGAYISELSKALNVEPKKIVLAIKKLKEDGVLV